MSWLELYMCAGVLMIAIAFCFEGPEDEMLRRP